MKKIFLLILSQIFIFNMAIGANRPKAPVKKTAPKAVARRQPIKRVPQRKVIVKKAPVRVVLRPVSPVIVKQQALGSAALLKMRNENSIQFSNDLGKKMLALTNQFRMKNKLKPLKWDQRLANIARTHSIRMAEGKVPFGHAEFRNRVAKYPRNFKMAGENVATMFGYPNNALAVTTVNGWIKSPGHRRNLLGNFNHCAIASYRDAKGRWYFTQLLGFY